MKSYKNILSGRSDRVRTCGIDIPNGPMKAISAKNSFFRPLSARQTALFGAPQSTVSECSETVGGLLCGQQGFPWNHMPASPLAFTREAIAFYTVIITLNNS